MEKIGILFDVHLGVSCETQGKLCPILLKTALWAA